MCPEALSILSFACKGEKKIWYGDTGTYDGNLFNIIVHKSKIHILIYCCVNAAWFCVQMRQRVFTGVVTQMQEHHGIVDQEVHFPVRFVCLFYSALIRVSGWCDEIWGSVEGLWIVPQCCGGTRSPGGWESVGESGPGPPETHQLDGTESPDPERTGREQHFGLIF